MKLKEQLIFIFLRFFVSISNNKGCAKNIHVGTNNFRFSSKNLITQNSNMLIPTSDTRTVSTMIE